MQRCSLHQSFPWCWERLKAGGEGGDSGWDGWMASMTQRTWVWANSGRWRRIGKPGMLQFMGLQRVRHDLATERQQITLNMKTWNQPLKKCLSIQYSIVNYSTLWYSRSIHFIHLTRLKLDTHWTASPPLPISQAPGHYHPASVSLTILLFFGCAGSLLLWVRAFSSIEWGLLSSFGALSFSLQWFTWAPGTWASVAAVHGFSCSVAYGIFPDQGLNLCPPHQQADS